MIGIKLIIIAKTFTQKFTIATKGSHCFFLIIQNHSIVQIVEVASNVAIYNKARSGHHTTPLHTLPKSNHKNISKLSTHPIRASHHNTLNIVSKSFSIFLLKSETIFEFNIFSTCFIFKTFSSIHFLEYLFICSSNLLILCSTVFSILSNILSSCFLLS